MHNQVAIAICMLVIILHVISLKGSEAKFCHWEYIAMHACTTSITISKCNIYSYIFICIYLSKVCNCVVFADIFVSSIMRAI